MNFLKRFIRSFSPYSKHGDNTAKTPQEWANEYDQWRKEHPIKRLVHVVIRRIRAMYDYHIIRRYDYLKFRFWTRTHLMETGLKKGSYHCDSDRLFNALMLFNENYYESNAEHKLKWYNEQSVSDIYTVASFGYDESPEFELFMTSLKIHRWWKNYPNRLKEIDDLSDQRIRRDSKDDFENVMSFLDDSWMTAEQKEHNRELTKKSYEMAEKLDQEKKEMMLNIVRLYDKMW